MKNKILTYNRVICLCLSAIAVVTTQGCGQESQDGGDVVSNAVGTTAKYKWYMAGSTPAGETTIVRTGDGRITNESFVHWNNREYTLNSEFQLDSDGTVISQRITGISAFGAPIDEQFHIEDGVAQWSSVGEHGSATVGTAAFYIPNVYGATGSIGALVRAASANIDGEIALYPSGSARVERVTDEQISSETGPETVSLYAIHGIRFSPTYAWFDDDMELVAIDYNGWLSMIPEHWDTEALAKLSRVQTREDALLMERLAGQLAMPLEQALIFENVDVVDVDNGELLEDYHVLVEDGKIAALSNLPLEKDNAIRVDGTGKTLLPGLWDMHGHFGLADGILNIAGGITSVRDIGGVHDKVMILTEKFDSGEVVGPNTYRAGFIDKASQYAAGKTVTSLDEALDRVDFFAEHGYMQIKLYSSIEPSWVEPIAERAHAHGMRLSGHIPAFMSAEQAVRAGYDGIQHINMVFLNFLAGDREDTRQQIRFTLYGDKAGELDLDSKEVEDFIALLKEKNVLVDPTATIFDSMLRHVAGEPNPAFAPIIEHLPIAVSRMMYSPQMVLGDGWPKSAETQSAMLLKLYESGIQLVPGSDSYPAFTIHRELELYTEAGIPNAAVLKMATLDSARVVGVDDRTGSITVGKDSDLVLVDGNPLDDMSAVRHATLVMKGNTVYRPDVLYKAMGVTPFVKSAAF